MRLSAGIAAVVACTLALLVVLDRQVDSRFQGRLFAVPARVHARPLVLAPGQGPDRSGLLAHLARLHYREAPGPHLEPGEFWLRRGEIGIGRRPFPELVPGESGGRLLVRFDGRGRIASLRDGDGRSLPRAQLEPEPIASFYGDHWEEREPVALAALPAHLVDAVIAVEDRRFRAHGGLDLRRIVGALLANLRAGRVAQGGSTLTQQLVKNLYLSPERSLVRKLREAVMALLLERRRGKDEILGAYLNTIYLGQRGPVAIHGVGAAARHYFGKSATALDPAESALLVGLIRGPGLYAPRRRPEAARERRDAVLAILHEQGGISREAYERARAQPLGLGAAPEEEGLAPHFLAFLRQRLEARYGAPALERNGYAVLSTLDARLQRIAERSLARGLERLEQLPALAAAAESLEGAVVVVDPRRGEILALVGGRDYRNSQFNRAVQARRQPGSAFKPIVALAALAPEAEAEPAFTLASLLEDEPLRVSDPTGEWSPVNHGGEFRGAVTLREALEQSLNVPFARIGLTLGLERIVQVARRLGIESPLEPVPSLALGAAEVTLLELTGAYAVLAAGGARSPLHGLRAVVGPDGAVLEGRRVEAERVYPAEVVHLVTSALQGAVERGTAQGLAGLGYRGPVAGKTGTTNDYRDAWFIGYTPELAVGVWVGFDQNQSVGVTGAVAALPIFADFLVQALGADGGEAFERPAELERVRVNARLGMRAGFGCGGEPELFLPGTAPQDSCGMASPLGWLREGLGRLRDRLRAPPPEQTRERR